MTPVAAARIRASRRRRLASGALCAAVGTVVGIVVGLTRPWISKSSCKTEGHGEVMASPDGALAVQLVHEVCDRGWVLIEVLTRLEGWRTTTPQVRHVLAIWESSADGKDVAVRWSGGGAVRLELQAMLGVRVRPPPLTGLQLTLVQAPATRDDERRD